MKTLCSMIIAGTMFWGSTQVVDHPMQGIMGTTSAQRVIIGSNPKPDGEFLKFDEKINILKDSLIAYILIYLGVARISRNFFDIKLNQYISASDKQMNTSPQRILFIHSIPPTDKLSSYPQFFENEFLANSGAEYLSLQVYSLEDMQAKLRKLSSEGERFDRIEVFTHGSPGKFGFYDGSEVDVDNLRNISFDKDMTVATADADIRFLSCSLGGKSYLTGYDGLDFLAEFGRLMLPEGGNVFGATRDIVVYSDPLQLPVKDFGNPTQAVATSAIVHVVGFGVYMRVFRNMLPGVFRNPARSAKSFVHVSVEPQEAIEEEE